MCPTSLLFLVLLFLVEYESTNNIMENYTCSDWKCFYSSEQSQLCCNTQGGINSLRLDSNIISIGTIFSTFLLQNYKDYHDNENNFDPKLLFELSLYLRPTSLLKLTDLSKINYLIHIAIGDIMLHKINILHYQTNYWHQIKVVFTWNPFLLNEEMELIISRNYTSDVIPEIDGIDEISCSDTFIEFKNISIQYIDQPDKFSFGDKSNYSLQQNTAWLSEADALILNIIKKFIFARNKHSKIIDIPRDSLNTSDNNSRYTVRIFCGVYTTDKQHQTNLQAIANTWGRQCTEFLAFSTISDLQIPSIHLPHLGDENYDNMWQKVRTIWMYIYKHYINDFDYFFLSGDDTYVIMDNLYDYLESMEINSQRKHSKGLYMGRIFTMPKWNISYNTGGGGYILDRIALEKLGTNIHDEVCHPYRYDSKEDVLMALCLHNIGIKPVITTDDLGRQRFHHFPIGFEFSYQKNKIENDWYPKYDSEIKLGWDCCSNQSISFHMVDANTQYNIYAFLYYCPSQVIEDYYAKHGESFHNYYYFPYAFVDVM
eukprot:gene12927-17328_t